MPDNHRPRVMAHANRSYYLANSVIFSILRATAGSQLKIGRRMDSQRNLLRRCSTCPSTMIGEISISTYAATVSYNLVLENAQSITPL